MTANRRLNRELNDILENKLKSFRDIKIEDDNILQWTALVVPDNAPYNRAAFRVELSFPEQYPFVPPKIMFRTKIYHPNIDEKGNVCLQIINSDNWKPATRLEQVIQALVELINNPEPEHPLRSDLAEEFVKERKKFFKAAEEFSRKHGEKRPGN